MWKSKNYESYYIFVAMLKPVVEIWWFFKIPKYGKSGPIYSQKSCDICVKISKTSFFFWRKKKTFFFGAAKQQNTSSNPKSFWGVLALYQCRWWFTQLKTTFFSFWDMGSWTFSAFWRRASGIGVLFGRGQVESQFFLDAGQCNLSYFWELASRISVQFGRSEVESPFLWNAGTWNSRWNPSFLLLPIGGWLDLPNWFWCLSWAFFLFFSPMNSFFHFIQFQFKMKKWIRN